MECQGDRIKRDLDTVNQYTATPGQGVTRLTWSPEYMKAYRYVIDELKKIGAQVTVCRAGCLRGRLAGTEPGLPAVMSGSHIDTVVNGGRFDGTVGTFAALEAARVIVETRTPHRHPIDIVVFPEEEGSRYGIGLVGSAAWTGAISLDRLYRAVDPEGQTYEAALAAAGVVVEDDSLLQAEKIKNMLEIHIEQSIVLDKEGLSIGVIESIAGLRWFDLTVIGTANHAGGTPMAYRQDAFQGAVRIIAEVENIAANKMGPHTVGTCGRIKIEPGSINVIPGRAEMTFDLRDAEMDNLLEMPKKIEAFAAKVCRERGLTYEMSERVTVPPVAVKPYVSDLLLKKAEGRGIKAKMMMSGALHDSCKLAELTDIGMLFVPSVDGRSHCPEEMTDWRDIKLGADILLDALVELAN